MSSADRFDTYLDHLSGSLGHADRHKGLRGYCTGLLLPLSRKSTEPMAARLDPEHESARHQSLHHFVAKADWSDAELLRRVCRWVVPKMDFTHGGWWIVDDTGFPKKGRHSVGLQGWPRKRSDKIHADRGYDYVKCRRALRERGIQSRIARRGVQSSERLGRHRWVVERTYAWFAEFGKLRIRFERQLGTHLAPLKLACAIPRFRFIERLF